MLQPHNLLDDIAAQVLYDLSLSAPIDAFDLAAALDLQAIPADLDGGAVLADHVIGFDARVLPQRAQHLIAHEISHRLALDLELDHDEEDADYLAAALQIPAGALWADVRALGTDLPLLHQRHRFASKTLLARRVAEIVGGSMCMLERGRRRWGAGRRPEAARRLTWQLSVDWAVALSLPDGLLS